MSDEPKNTIGIPSGYFAHMYTDERGNQKWRLYDGSSERGKLVAEGLRDHTAIKKAWAEYQGKNYKRFR